MISNVDKLKALVPEVYETDFSIVGELMTRTSICLIMIR